MAQSPSTQIHHNVVPLEVGWQFVPQYYHFINKQPNRLHCFYTKTSTFIHGTEGEEGKPCYGQQEIHNRITAIGFQDCKVFIHSVDAQSSANGGIIIQAIGEMSNAGGPWRKFVQTFFLAEQPNGYFVLNDIFRFLKEETVEDEGSEMDESAPPMPVPEPHVEPESEAPRMPSPSPAPPPAEEVTVSPPSPSPSPEPEPVHTNGNGVAAHEEEEPAPAEPSPVPTPARSPSPAPPAAQQPATVSFPTPSANTPAPSTPAKPSDSNLPATSAPEPSTSTPAAATPSNAPSSSAPAPPPQAAPAATGPPPQPQQPSAPPAPKTWANLAATNSKKWGATAASESRGISENAPPVAPSPGTQTPNRGPQRTGTPGAGGQPGGGNTNAGPNNNAPTNEFLSTITTPQVFIKGVLESVTQQSLQIFLTTRFGPLKDLEIVRSRACAFLEFNSIDSARRAIAASMSSGGVRIEVEGGGSVRMSIETRKERGDRPGPGGGRGGGPRGGAGGSGQGGDRGGYRGRGAPGVGRGRGGQQGGGK